MMRPIIAISFQVEDDHPSLSIQRTYIDFVESLGGTALMLLPQQDEERLIQVLAGVDGVIVPGGDDIDPALYGQVRASFRDEPKPDRDAFEPRLIRACADQGIPYLGICRGLQIANVAFGGTLHQNIADWEEGHLDHWQSEPFSKPSHKVAALPGGLCAGIYGVSEVAVNSIHHQAIDAVAHELHVEAVSEDGVIEALSLPTHRFFLGVQWHPEMDPEADFSKPLGAAFAEACKKRMGQRTSGRDVSVAL